MLNLPVNLAMEKTTAKNGIKERIVKKAIPPAKKGIWVSDQSETMTWIILFCPMDLLMARIFENSVLINTKPYSKLISFRYSNGTILISAHLRKHYRSVHVLLTCR